MAPDNEETSGLELAIEQFMLAAINQFSWDVG